MRAGGGKAKGGEFERQICKRLSLWVSEGKRIDLFWRSAMSGGRATVAHRKGVVVRQGGDVTAVASEGHILTDHFLIECKFHRDLQVDRFMLMGKGPILKFLKHAIVQARRHKKNALLIARQNGLPTIVVGHAGSAFGRPQFFVGEYPVWLFDSLMKTEFAFVESRLR